jgi:hypothetical protein
MARVIVAAARRPRPGPCRYHREWTIANPTAGPGYFLTGDAASIVDPLSSHGILKAVMSGMKAAHHSAAVLRRGVSPDAGANDYHTWLARWFRQDHSRLGELYSAISGIPTHDLLQSRRPAAMALDLVRPKTTESAIFGNCRNFISLSEECWQTRSGRILRSSGSWSRKASGMCAH